MHRYPSGAFSWSSCLSSSLSSVCFWFFRCLPSSLSRELDIPCCRYGQCPVLARTTDGDHSQQNCRGEILLLPRGWPPSADPGASNLYRPRGGRWSLAACDSGAEPAQRVCLDSGAVLSPLLASQTSRSGIQAGFALPGVGLNYTYTTISFRPDGSREFLGGSDFATLKAARLDDPLSQLPENYAIIQVNPDSGRSRTYRP